MRKSIRVLLGLSLFLISSQPMLGCGDKYLSVGRGARFQRGYVSTRPVTVGVLKSGVTARKDFLSRLKLAGHRVELAKDVTELGTLIAAAKIDVVLAGYAEAPAVDALLVRIAQKPLFLPVVDASSASAATAHKEYGCLLNSDSKAKRRNFLAVLDEALESNRKAKPVKCDLTQM